MATKTKTIVFEEKMFERMDVFATKVKHASTLTGWIKSTLVEAVANARPEEKEELNKLLGI